MELPMLNDRKELLKFAVGKVLDIGCGDAYPWNGDVPSHVTCLDLDMWDYENFVLGDALHLPFKDKSFDTCVLMEVMEHIDKGLWAVAVSEAKRVARERVIISSPDSNEKNMNIDYEGIKRYLYSKRKFKKMLSPPEAHLHRYDNMMSIDDLLKIIEYFNPKWYKIFRIENRFYSGYGMVMNLT